MYLETKMFCCINHLMYALLHNSSLQVETHLFLKMCLQMIPRNFVERYWNDVPNPISLILPNGSACKMNWVQHGDGIWLLNWKMFARSLRCGDLLVFKYKGGSDFHVIVLDDCKLEIDYSSMRFNDDQEKTKESDDDDDDNDNDYECVEIASDSENTKIPLKKKRVNSNGIATTAATPQGANIDKRKINMNATKKNVSGKLIYFLLFIHLFMGKICF